MIYTYLLGFTLLLNLLLGIFILLKNSRSQINFSFSLFVFSVVAWMAVNYFLNQFLDESTALLLNKLIFVIVPYIGFSLLYFSIVFPSNLFNLKLKHLFLLLVPVFISNALVFLNLVITGITFTSGGVTGLIFGPAAPYFALLFLVYLGCGIIILITKFVKSSGYQHLQFQYIVLGVGILTVFAIITNFIFPVFFNYSPARSIWPFFSLAVFGFTGYAIIRHSLMDTRLIIARTVFYLVFTFIIVSLHVFLLFVIGQLLFHVILDPKQLVFSVIFTLTIVYFFQPIRRFWESISNNIFFQERYDPEELLGKISNLVTTTLELKVLINGFFQHLLQALHLDFGALFIIKGNSLDRLFRKNIKVEAIGLEPKELKYILTRKRRLIIFEELGEGKLKNLMRKYSLGAVVKLDIENKNVGILVLGRKKSGSILLQNDVYILGVLGPQLAVAIQNAQSYEEIKEFSQKLRKEVKKATSALRNANEKLKDLDKQKDEFISMAAHELRAPLTAIKGYLSMTMEGDAGDIPEKARGFLADTNAINERLIRLVNNMLNVSRIEEGRMVYQWETESLSRITRTVFAQFTSEAERKSLKFSLEIPREIKDKVYVDPDRIYEVVGNLVSNAVKYTDRGSVVISLSQPSKNKVRFEVIDTGPGISNEERKKLFRKFYRAESSVGKTIGTGLGLYISKLLIEKFNGKIGLESEIGEGSTFWFELPLEASGSPKNLSTSL